MEEMEAAERAREEEQRRSDEGGLTQDLDKEALRRVAMAIQSADGGTLAAAQAGTMLVRQASSDSAGGTMVVKGTIVSQASDEEAPSDSGAGTMVVREPAVGGTVVVNGTVAIGSSSGSGAMRDENDPSNVPAFMRQFATDGAAAVAAERHTPADLQAIGPSGASGKTGTIPATSLIAQHTATLQEGSRSRSVSEPTVRWGG